MDTYDLFTRYSRALVSKKLKRTEIYEGKNKCCSRQRLDQLEKICFDNYSYKIYEKINNLLTKKGL